MTKKLLNILFIFILFMCFSSCCRESDVDFLELVTYLSQELDDDSININNAFFYNDEWYLFLSLTDEEDILIKAKENKNKHLSCVSISTVKSNADLQEDSFKKMCSLVAEIIITKDDSRSILEKINLNKKNVIFSDEVYFYEYGFYKLSFFNSEVGSMLQIECLDIPVYEQITTAMSIP